MPRIGTSGTNGILNGRSRSGRFFRRIDDADAHQHERQQRADVHQLPQDLERQEAGRQRHRERR